jgi:hypothetical protein
VESGFRSVPDVAAEMYWFLPVRRVARLHYPVESYLRSIHVPVLIVHSREDETIPFSHGEALFAAANAPKRLLEIDGDHNDGFLVSGKSYIRGLVDFLDSLDL